MHTRFVLLFAFLGRVALAILLGIGTYLGMLIAFTYLPMAPWDAKRLLPFVVLLAISLACIVAVVTLRMTKISRSPTDPAATAPEAET